MATYKLIPSSWYGSYSTTNPSNAYHDTTNTTYTSIQVYNGTTSYPAWLRGFDFSVIPQDQRITGITVKVKMSRGNYPFTCALYSGVDGAQLSALQDATLTVTTYTLDLTSSLDTILNYSSTLCLRFSTTGGSVNHGYVYGAEIIVETMSYSKVVYDGNTLIDLTSDTATASDVAVGKTFHLASGAQATGALSVSVKTATSKPTSISKPQTVSFTNLQNEPSWFVLCATDNSGVSMSRPVCYILYDGETTTTFYASSTSSSAVVSTHELTSGNAAWTFSYSSGTLTLSSSSATTSPIFSNVSNSTLYYI